MPLKSNHDGERVAGGAENLHVGSGRLLGYLISHNQATAQLVTFYDSATASGTVLHQVYVSPERSPVYVRFGLPPGKEEGIPFGSGLTIDPGSCEVAVWCIGY